MLLSVRLQDEAAFERNFVQLKTYYTDSRCAAPAVCYHRQPKERTASASVSCRAANQRARAGLAGHFCPLPRRRH